mgnify:CR=1 FL=1
MAEKKLMKGNEAIAEAAIRGGCRFYAGYPITPQNEIPEYLSWRLFEVGGQFVQSESEVAAINMVYGAAAAGTRAMTSSSSPGISLKQEGISYIAGAELPCVIINMVRGGPGLGGIQPAQSDYFQATKGGGHGDYHMLVYGPNSVQECVDILYNAFDKADEYRIPVMILGDGMLGQMMEPVEIGEGSGGSSVEKPWAACGHNGGRKHNIVNSLYLQAADLERLVRERFARYAVIEEKEPMSESYMVDDAEYVIVAYGASARVAKAAVREAREQGIKAGLIRPITLWPFPKQAMRDAAEHAKAFLCVEMSMGQMIDDVKLAIDCSRPVEFFGRTGGIIPTPAEVLENIKKLAGGEK